MNDHQLRLFGINLVNKSIENFIDNNLTQFELLYNTFMELTKDNKDDVHWHSDIDVYLNTCNLDVRNELLVKKGETQLQFLENELNGINNNNIMLSLYSLQYFFEHGCKYYISKYQTNDN
jgi:aminopeptidase N